MIGFPSLLATEKQLSVLISVSDGRLLFWTRSLFLSIFPSREQLELPLFVEARIRLLVDSIMTHTGSFGENFRNRYGLNLCLEESVGTDGDRYPSIGEIFDGAMQGEGHPIMLIIGSLFLNSLFSFLAIDVALMDMVVDDLSSYAPLFV